MQKIHEITFDFKETDTSYLTHSIHPYPAKFPPHLPKKLLDNFSVKGQTVLDPFCGSGTTLVEARLKGINSIGVDVNGLACLLSKVKSTSISSEQAQVLEHFISMIEEVSFRWSLGNRFRVEKIDFEGLSHWFQTNVAEEITLLLSEIEKINDQVIRDFLRIALSSIIVRVSNQESDTRFAAIEKNITDGYTLNLFVNKTKEYLERLLEFSKIADRDSSVCIYNSDSRNLNFIDDESIDIIITSPPYANTNDYYLYHKFRKRWLGIDVKYAQYNEIGSRREFSSLKQEPEKWFEDLKQCFSEISRVIKKNSLAFIVIGDSVIQKTIVRIDKEIEKFSPSLGLVVRHIISSDLSNHSKIFNPTFAQKGKKEHLIILEKT